MIRLSLSKTLGNFHDARACVWASKIKAVMFDTKVHHFPLLPPHQTVSVSPHKVALWPRHPPSGTMCMPPSEIP